MRAIVVFMFLLMALVAQAANPAFQDFNVNQFGTGGNKVSVKAGVRLTNAVIANATANRIALIANDSTLTNGPANAVGAVTNDGSGGFGYFDISGLNPLWTNIAGVLSPIGWESTVRVRTNGMIELTNGLSSLELTNGGIQGRTFAGSMASSPGSTARLQDGGGIAKAYFDRSTNCTVLSLIGSLSTAYFDRSTNCLVGADSGSYAGGFHRNAITCNTTAGEGAYGAGWFEEATNCSILGLGGSHAGGGFFNVSNCNIKADLGFAQGYFLQGANNARIDALQGSIAVGRVSDGARIFATEGSIAVGDNIAVTNGAVFGASYTNDQKFSFAVGTNGVTSFRARYGDWTEVGHELSVAGGITNNGALTNAGLASFRTNSTTYGTNEMRWGRSLGGEGDIRDYFRMQNPDNLFTDAADFSMTSTKHDVPGVTRSNVVLRIGHNTLKETPLDSAGYITWETAWFTDRPMYEWYVAFQGTNNTDEWRPIAYTFATSNAMTQQRLDLRATQVFMGGEQVFWYDRDLTNKMMELASYDAGGGNWNLYGDVRLQPFTAFGGGATPTVLYFFDSLGTRISSIHQDGNIFHFQGQSGNLKLQFGSLFTNVYFNGATVSVEGEQRLSSTSVIGFTGSSAGFDSLTSGFSRLGSASVALGNGTAGNIAGNLTASNANFAGTVSITNALKVGLVNAGTLTNVLYGSATLNFGSTSSGAIEDLAITVTGASDGDIVSVGVPQTAATGIIGSYSGFASNNTVFVRFTPTAATQNPNSGTFKVMVHKFQ